MKLTGKFVLAFLSLSLVFSGISGAAFAAVAPLSVETDKEFYVSGAVITISGFVKDYDGSTDVTIVITSPIGNIVRIDQVTPSSDGNYSTTVIASGTFADEGDYTVKARWGAQANEVVFKFGGGTSAPVPEEEKVVVVEEPVVVEEVVVDERSKCTKNF